MGLDIVEFVMAVEEEFGVRIPDRVAERMRTVGHLYEFLKGQRDMAPDAPCPAVPRSTAFAVYCAPQTGLPRHAIAPCTPLEVLLPGRGRREFWQSFQGSVLPLHVPNLSPPLWWVVLLFVVIGPALIAALGLSVPLSIQRQAPLLPLAIMIGSPVLVFTVWLTKRMSVGLPGGIVTMRGLVRATLGGRREHLEWPDGGYLVNHGSLMLSSDEEVWKRLRAIVADRFGIDPSKITPETDFVYLGA